jgi:hypothetical protein
MSVQDLSECEPSQSSANDQNFAMFVDAPHGRLARASMVWDGISSDIERYFGELGTIKAAFYKQNRPTGSDCG